MGILYKFCVAREESFAMPVLTTPNTTDKSINTEDHNTQQHSSNTSAMVQLRSVTKPIQMAVTPY